VFCDGDFWHGRNWPRLRRQLLKRNNASYWVAKIQSNRRRDRLTDAELRSAGWDVHRFWETDILRDPQAMVARVSMAVRSRI
jgi:DNA mismatch endonuclease (patch repair protein)